jgi:hypothetical protein
VSRSYILEPFRPRPVFTFLEKPVYTNSSASPANVHIAIEEHCKIYSDGTGP